MNTLPAVVRSLLLPALLALSFAGCTSRKSGPEGAPLLIGMVAKSQSNPIFQAAYAGAQDAARELSPAYGVEIRIDWQTPPDENPQKQAEAIEQLARSGVRGIAVSCSDANTVTPAINKAVDLGALVVTFDSDAPQSRRMCFFGTDDVTCGRMVMRELAAAMDSAGTVAILAGNQSAPNLQNRVRGVREELANYPRMKLLEDGIFYHSETPEQAAEAVMRAQTTNSSIQGWARVGGWALLTKNALRWSPGTIKVVSVDALPAELPYLESGHVHALLAQDSYQWGYTSVRLILDKLLKNTQPAETRIIDPLTRVTKENVQTYYANWEKWLRH